MFSEVISEVLRIPDLFPECGKESLIFKIYLSENGDSLDIIKDIKVFLNMCLKLCLKHKVKPELKFVYDVYEDMTHIEIHVREDIIKINDMHKEWDEWAKDKYY